MAPNMARKGVRRLPLFFQAINNKDGMGIFLGDGLRCAGGSLKRIQVRMTDGSGSASTTIGISAKSAAGGDSLSAGDTRYYQWWIRDPGGSPCGNLSNTSNGYAINWLP